MMYIINYSELRHLLNAKAPVHILKAMCCQEINEDDAQNQICCYLSMWTRVHAV